MKNKLKNITLGTSLINKKAPKYEILGIYFDENDKKGGLIHVCIDSFRSSRMVSITPQEAEKIGFINPSALELYCNKDY